jgi:HSP20 family molecular chaperone IbpA
VANIHLFDFGLFQFSKNLGVTGNLYHLYENDEEMVLSLGVPGLVREDIDVILSSRKRIIIKSKRGNKFTPRFQYIFSIPSKVKKDDIYASVISGVLEVHIKRDNEWL